MYNECAKDPYRGTLNIGVNSISHKLEEEQKKTSPLRFFLNLFTVVVRILTQAAFLAHFSRPILPAAVNVDPKEARESRDEAWEEGTIKSPGTEQSLVRIVLKCC